MISSINPYNPPEEGSDLVKKKKEYVIVSQSQRIIMDYMDANMLTWMLTLTLRVKDYIVLNLQQGYAEKP